MYVVLWRFRPLVGRESEFERAYGPSGEWTRLFRRGDGYLSTELLRRSDDPRRVPCPRPLGLSRCLRSIPSPLEQRVSAARPSVGSAHRGGDSPWRLRGAPLESPIVCQDVVCSFLLPLFTRLPRSEILGTSLCGCSRKFAETLRRCAVRGMCRLKAIARLATNGSQADQPSRRRISKRRANLEATQQDPDEHLAV
jgi:hypothetical protein